jgi:hypothetical protein
VVHRAANASIVRDTVGSVATHPNTAGAGHSSATSAKQSPPRGEREIIACDTGRDGQQARRREPTACDYGCFRSRDGSSTWHAGDCCTDPQTPWVALLSEAIHALRLIPAVG